MAALANLSYPNKKSLPMEISGSAMIVGTFIVQRKLTKVNYFRVKEVSCLYACTMDWKNRW